VTLQGLILATSFGQRDLDKLPAAPTGVDLYRDYTPGSKLEKLLAFADICDLGSSFNDFIVSSLNVVKEARSTTSFDNWLVGRMGFVKFIESSLDGIVSEINSPSYLHVKREQVREYRDTLEQLSADPKHKLTIQYRLLYEAATALT
jgi:hypothetical protein